MMLAGINYSDKLASFYIPDNNTAYVAYLGYDLSMTSFASYVNLNIQNYNIQTIGYTLNSSSDAYIMMTIYPVTNSSDSIYYYSSIGK